MDPKQSSEFQDPSSSNSLHIVLARYFSIFIKAKSIKGHNSINVLQNSLKSSSGHLNNDPKLYAKYQKPSLSSF